MAEYADMFKYAVIAPPVGATSATFAVNPEEIDWQIGQINTIVDVMDGEPVIQRPLSDNRIRQMIWRKWPVTNSTIIDLIDQITIDMLNQEFWFIDGSIGYFSDWTKCRGINLTKTFRSGSGKVRYAEIIFEFIIIDTEWTEF